jgi:hypothetical protein
MKFYIGLHQPRDSENFDRAFISVKRLVNRVIPIPCKDWILDSGAFSEVAIHGAYTSTEQQYANRINKLQLQNGSNLTCAVSQDYMCEAFVLKKTGLTVRDHQRLTIERYDNLKALVKNTYLMPVLQGYAISEYIEHIEQYEDRLTQGAYVGIGSVCKRNGDPKQIANLLWAIKQRRPDLLLHGFGLKLTALANGIVRKFLFSADSMAWSYGARILGRSGNDWTEAQSYLEKVERLLLQ